MKDAFGVNKSFTRVNGVVSHLPISQMSAAERNGIRGVHRSTKGMTTIDRDIQESWNAGAATRAEFDNVPVNGRTKKGRSLKVIETADKSMNMFAAPKPGESQRTMARRMFVENNPSKRAHEDTHADGSKPASRAFRFLRHPEKLWGDEARADMAMSPQARMKYNAYWANATSHSQGKGTVSNLSPLYREGLERGGGKRYLDVKEKIKADRLARQDPMKPKPMFARQKTINIPQRNYSPVSKASLRVNLGVIGDNPKGAMKYLLSRPKEKVYYPLKDRMLPVQRAKKHESGFFRTTPRPAHYKGKHKA